MANRNNPQTSNQQNRTRNNARNRGSNRDYGRDYGNFNQRDFTTSTFYTPDYAFPYEEDFYDFDTGNYPDTWTYEEFWLEPGPFVGYGPTDWQRSDENIREDVNERLTLHGQLDARQIHVQVDNGEVTLTGNVQSRRDKRLAEDIADSVTGVTDVQNQLHIENKNMKGQSQSQFNQGQQQFGQGGQSQAGGQQVQIGMEVDSQDGHKIGKVNEVRNNEILVGRTLKEDIFVPFSAFSVRNGKVMLHVNADQVNDQGWQTPETRAVQSHR